MTARQAQTILITTDAVGGVWSYSIALAAGAAASGWRCILAVIGPAPNDRQRQLVADIPGGSLVETGLPLEWCLSSRPQLEDLSGSLAALSRAHNAESVHLHAPALAAHPWTVPVATVAHSCMATWWDCVRGGSRPGQIAWHVDATAQGLRQANAVISPSGSFADLLTRAYDLRRDIHVVYNGLTPPALPTAERSDVILAAGRLWDAGKNISVLDQAAGLLSTPVHAAGSCVGPDGESVDYANLVLTGEISSDDLHAAMEQAAIFASPSRYEPFGLAVLEAAQRGAALVLSDIPVFRELWEDAAVFVSVDDVNAWVINLRAISEDATRRAALSRAARERANRYTRSAMVEATTGIHRGMVAGQKRAA